MLMPFQVLGVWIRGLIALALIGCGVTLLALWNNNRKVVVIERPSSNQAAINTATDRQLSEPNVRIETWRFGLNWPTFYLLAGTILLIWSLGGGNVYQRRLRAGGQEPQIICDEMVYIPRPDGSQLRVALYGPQNGMPIVLTHGWSLSEREWYYTKRELGRKYLLITWDLPGHGQSYCPRWNDWSLEKLARDLDAVIDKVVFKPTVLIGHSIGGMIILTYCKLFREKLGPRVSAVVLAHTTYTNPVKTTRWPVLMQALQKPVLEPLAHLMIWLSPFVRIFNCLSYLNGSAHRSTERRSFTGRESRAQLELITREYVKAKPANVGGGFLAMFDYEAADVLPDLPVPALLVTAANDRTCIPEASEYMVRTIPNASLVRLGDGGHCAIVEFHEQFHAAVTDFVARLGSQPAVPDEAFLESKRERVTDDTA